MRTLKPLFIALTLSTIAFTTQATESIIVSAPKQVAGYYQHQVGNTNVVPLIRPLNSVL